MEPSKGLTRIVNKKRYCVDTAVLLAQVSDTLLYRTAKGSYFAVEHPSSVFVELIPVDQDKAIAIYENMWERGHLVSYEEAFPGVKVEDA